MNRFYFLRTEPHRVRYSAILLTSFLLAALALLVRSGVDVRPVQSAPGDVGYQGSYFGSGVSAPTERESQSKLWYNDGLWWASMYNRTASRFEIHRLNQTTQTWSTTGVAIDDREGSKSDALWDGSRLYIASAAFPTMSSDYRIDLLRYSYDRAAKTFSLDAGFPVRVDTGAVIAVVIDKDSTGRLWMTYTKPSVPTCVDDPNGTYNAPTCTRDVFVTHGTTSDNNVWVTPYSPRKQTQGNLVTQMGKDAISSLVPFGGGKMGLVWDHPNYSALYFTYHTDGAGDADSNWSPIVTVVRKADNHINLKSLLSDPAGKIYAVVKNDCNEPSGGGCSGTGTVNPNDALIWLFTLDVSGVQSYTVSRVQDKQTRPMLGIDRQNRRLYVFATTGDVGNRSITVKQTPMDRISFEEGSGVPFIQSSTSTNINDAATTKQSMTSESGLVVLASDSTSRYYFHNSINLANTDPVLVGAGDIARCDGTGDEATANLIANLQGPFSVFTVGDNVYPDGRINYFNNCYQPSWGAQKYRTFPALGNHEYVNDPGATGYFSYFGAAAGDPGTGYYSYDMGTWHIVVLNSNCSAVGGCGAGSPQEQWLRADLSANRDKNVLAYFHHPRFSSSAARGNNAAMRPFWQALYEYGADLVVDGHEHFYERFAPQDPDGVADPVYGIRQITVGVGGFGAGYAFSATPAQNSEVRNNDTLGIIKLTLRPNSYEWQFMPVPGATFTDSGSGATHGPPGALPPTATSTNTPIPTSTLVAGSTPTSTPSATGTATATPSTVGLTCVDAVFTNAVNVTVTGSGNSIQKTGGSGSAYDAGARSTQQVEAGDIAAEFTIDAMGTRKVFGLSHDDIGQTRNEIDYAFMTSPSSSSLYVFENGVQAPVGLVYSAGDVLRVEAKGGVVRYYRNGILAYTSAQSPIYPLFADTSIFTPAASITNVKVCGSTAPSATATVPAVSTATATVVASATNTPVPTSTATQSPELTKTAIATATLTPIAVATTFTFSPDADARVEQSTPDTNYGTSGNLQVNAGSEPGKESYLRFTVTGITGTVDNVRLRVYVYNGTVDGPAVYSTDSTWSETGITWNNRPARTSAATDKKGAIAANSWVEFNVTPLVNGNGTYSFVLAKSTGDGMYIYSKQSSSPPQLVVSTK